MVVVAVTAATKHRQLKKNVSNNEENKNMITCKSDRDKYMSGGRIRIEDAWTRARRKREEVQVGWYDTVDISTRSVI
jgi:hypothetical protein